jgi:hypothetical protein
VARKAVNRLRLPQLPEPEPRMHAVACQHCPSTHHAPDPQVLDTLKLPFAQRLETCFPCGWNPKRYCRGYCEAMGVSDADLQRQHEDKR